MGGNLNLIQNDRVIKYGFEDKKRGASVAELQEKLLYWQKKLKMNDWKLDLKIVDFQRENEFKQSGDFLADPQKKIASVLMTWNPWRGDEEYTLVHEMIHILFCDYDKYCENIILKHYEAFDEIHNNYFDKLEALVHHLTEMILGRKDPINALEET